MSVFVGVETPDVADQLLDQCYALPGCRCLSSDERDLLAILKVQLTNLLDGAALLEIDVDHPALDRLGAIECLTFSPLADVVPGRFVEIAKG